MRLYLGTADCLVTDCLCKVYVKARNERQAWIKAYLYFNKLSVADGGTVDIERVKNVSRETLKGSII